MIDEVLNQPYSPHGFHGKQQIVHWTNPLSLKVLVLSRLETLTPRPARCAKVDPSPAQHSQAREQTGEAKGSLRLPHYIIRIEPISHKLQFQSNKRNIVGLPSWSFINMLEDLNRDIYQWHSWARAAHELELILALRNKQGMSHSCYFSYSDVFLSSY